MQYLGDLESSPNQPMIDANSELHMSLTYHVPMPSPSLQAKLLVRKTLYMSIAALLRWARLIDAIIGLDAKSPWLDGLVVAVSESTISQVWGVPSVGLPLPREPKTHEIVGSAGKKKRFL